MKKKSTKTKRKAGKKPARVKDLDAKKNPRGGMRLDDTVTGSLGR